jgi:hypothetical protein
LAQNGSFSVDADRPAVSFSASTVGNQTILHCERPASSTATGFKPPTLWLSVIAPKALMPGTAFVTTWARSPVGT